MYESGEDSGDSREKPQARARRLDLLLGSGERRDTRRWVRCLLSDTPLL